VRGRHAAAHADRGTGAMRRATRTRVRWLHAARGRRAVGAAADGVRTGVRGHWGSLWGGAGLMRSGERRPERGGGCAGIRGLGRGVRPVGWGRRPPVRGADHAVRVRAIGARVRRSGRCRGSACRGGRAPGAVQRWRHRPSPVPARRVRSLGRVPQDRPREPAGVGVRRDRVTCVFQDASAPRSPGPVAAYEVRGAVSGARRSGCGVQPLA
jgi:hypothetical protein